jgi:hypothetical protein
VKQKKERVLKQQTNRFQLFDRMQREKTSLTIKILQTTEITEPRISLKKFLND